MKYLLFISFAVTAVGCQLTTKQRDAKITTLLKKEVDSLCAADTLTKAVVDSVVLLQVKTITEKQMMDIAIAATAEDVKRLRDWCQFIKKKLNSTRAAAEFHRNDTSEMGRYYVNNYQSDTARLRTDSIKIALANKMLDSLRSVATSAAFWGYYVNTRIYFHNDRNTPINIERAALVTRDFKIDQF